MSFLNEDEALIAAALNGSAYAWEKLVKRYEGRLYNYGLRLTGNASDAMDLLQEVFLGVYRNLHRFRGDAKFSSWLFRIAHNKAVDMNRRKRLMSTKSDSIDQDENGQIQLVDEDLRNRPEAKLLTKQQNNQILNMLESLPLQQRLIVELKFYQSQTFEEIAQGQGISTNTAKTRYYSALKKLKSESEKKHVLS
ncbi:MAG: RNA polymerase subunit sigma-70 [SAR86 cluster bacterium]|uniref:RNA polymerase subunit sigma-70 n=1 Tax=SAR86 cluster bacterium TaxID=2030880 RepID=A0A2A4MPP1_9GAMM|nr:MAG: RNA polymerase subunit sigma-70 [SAR86 cluster bacterium]